MNSFASFKSRIAAAEGYIELGMPLEANDELEQIDSFAFFLGGAAKAF